MSLKSAPNQKTAPKQRTRRWLIWVPVVLFAMLAVCAGGGALAYTRYKDRWLRIDGLPGPSAALDEVLTTRIADGAKSGAAITDGSTVYHAAGTDSGLVVAAEPLAGHGHRWSITLPTGQAAKNLRLTLLPGLLLVAAGLPPGQKQNQMNLVLRVADGSQAWLDRWAVTDLRRDAALVGTDLIGSVRDGERDRGLVRRVDLATGIPKWTYPVEESVDGVVVPTTWGENPTDAAAYAHVDIAGTVAQRLRSANPVDPGAVVAWDTDSVVHVIDGGTGQARITKELEPVKSLISFGGTVFAILREGKPTVVAYDLATLTEKWRRPVVDVSRADDLRQCGPDLLCVWTGHPLDDKVIYVIDAATGETRNRTSPVRDPISATTITPLTGRLLGTDSANTSLVDSVDPWKVTPLRYERLGVTTLASEGRTAVVRVSARSPIPGNTSGYHLMAVDVERRRLSEPVFVGPELPLSVDVNGGHLVIVTSEGRVLVLRNPFG